LRIGDGAAPSARSCVDLTPQVSNDQRRAITRPVAMDHRGFEPLSRRA